MHPRHSLFCELPRLFIADFVTLRTEIGKQRIINMDKKLLLLIINILLPFLAYAQAMEVLTSLHKALADYNPYQIEFENDAVGRVPFTIKQVGPEDKGNVMMFLSESKINEKDADIIFDTGAGVNIISEAIAAKYNLIPLNTSLSVTGVKSVSGQYAIAKELKLGNITVKDVPFLVLPMSSKNKKLDQYFSEIEIIVGCELMVQLKDFTLDFENNEIVIPAVPPVKSEEKPNMYISSTMNLDAMVNIQDTPVNVCIDTGNASYGNLNYDFFRKHKDYVLSHSTKGIFRIAGIGGVNKAKSYSTSGMSLTLGSNTVTTPRLDVIVGKKAKIKNRLGLKSLMLFGKIRFNMIDFVLSTVDENNK